MTSHDLTGQKIGYLSILSLNEERDINKQRIWKCLCDCGKICYKPTTQLTRKIPTLSCGCQYINIRRKSKKCYTGYKDLTGSYFCQIKIRAKRRNILFNVSIEYLWSLYEQQNGKCALTGLPICFSPSYAQKYKQTASLDRIDNTKAYIEGNVWWVHKDINCMKMAHTLEEFVKYCELVYKEQQNKQSHNNGI